MKKACVVPDEKWPNMYRVQWPDGSLSDMVNLSRANDAAARFNETQGREQRGRQRGDGRSYSDFPAVQAPGQSQSQKTTLTTPSSLAA